MSCVHFGYDYNLASRCVQAYSYTISSFHARSEGNYKWSDPWECNMRVSTMHWLKESLDTTGVKARYLSRPTQARSPNLMWDQ